jgi:C4-dicarboxylate-specific signal transduction histidine kinase
VSWALWGVCWLGWALAVAAAWTLRRRMACVADAEHELRGAATAIGLAAELTPLLQLELDRMGAALTDLAEARGARPAPPADLEAGRLAQVLANVIANAAEHGVGPVEVRAVRPAGGLARLEVRNRDRTTSNQGAAPGRGRGLLIAKRAARELGGRVSVESGGGFTRTVVELPAGAPADERDDGRRAA